MVGGHVPFIVHQLIISFLLLITFVTHLFYFNEYAKFKLYFNVEQLFTSIMIAGFISLFMAVLPNMLDGTVIDLSNSPKINRLLHMLFIYTSLIYFLHSFAIFRKLMLKRKDNAIMKRWKLLVAFLVMTTFMSLNEPLRIPSLVAEITLVAGGLIILPMLVRIKWIAFLTKKVQWLCIFFLLGIVSISLVLIQKLYSLKNFQGGRDPMQYVVADPITLNVFWLLIICCVVIYSLLSLATLVFNLPIFSVIEEKKSEIESYQEISTALNLKESDEETFERLFNVCYSNTMSNSGWLVVNSAQNGQIYEHVGSISEEQIKTVNQRINFEALIKREPKNGYYYFPDLVKSRVFTDKNTAFRSMLILPIFNSAKFRGAICLVSPMLDGYDEYMINLTKSYVDQAKLALENARLLEKTIQAARYKEELEIAQRVQQALLPKTFPPSEYCEIAAFAESAREVGGDYYDYNQIDDYRLALIIGDVSGKGTDAAFHMAQMKGIFQSLMQLCPPSDNFMMMANTAASNCLEKGRFVTLIYIALDFVQNVFTFSRAGHCPLLYYNAETKEVDYLSGDGLGLGIIRDSRYNDFVDAHNYPLNVGDVLVLYTDGLVEGRQYNSEEEYDYDRLKNCLALNAPKSADAIKDAIIADFKSFTRGNNDYRDDTSLLVIKINELGIPLEPVY